MPIKLFDAAALRNDLLASLIEFLGTITFLLLGLGGIQASATSNAASLAAATSNNSADGGSAASINTVASIEQLYYIATSMGLALLVAAWVFYRASGSVFNPNVAFALVLTGVLTPQRFVLYTIVQFVGAIAASAILQGILPGPLAVTPSLGAGTNRAQGVWIETFLTTGLCLTVLMLAAEKSAITPFAPVGIGLVLFAGHLLGVVYTGAAMNTARAFGPSVVSGFNDEQWIYWLGPTIGAGLAVVIYGLLKAVHYQQLNPGQDAEKAEHSPEFMERILTSSDAGRVNEAPMQEQRTTTRSTAFPESKTEHVSSHGHSSSALAPPIGSEKRV